MSEKTSKLLSVKQASERLKVNRQRVLQLIGAKRLPAEKVGNIYVIRENDLKLVENRKAGRPQRSENSNQINGDGEKPFKTIFDVVPELAGSLDSGLGDLSTNKKYMEGFGRDKTINR